jgi:hypothetical protein
MYFSPQPTLAIELLKKLNSNNQTALTKKIQKAIS